MVNVAPVETLDHELPREPKIFAHLQCLLVHILRREVLRDAAVVSVRQFCFVVLMVEEVVHVHVVHVALDCFQINFAFIFICILSVFVGICAISSLGLLRISLLTILFIARVGILTFFLCFILFRLRFVFIVCLLQPSMS